MSTTDIIDAEPIELHHETHGRGEPLLLLHGFTGAGTDWAYAGRDALAERYQLIIVDQRGHGRSANPAPTITHRQSAIDVLALLDRLGIARCRAIGMSMGGNTLLHLASHAPERLQAMVTVSATPYFPATARAIMRQVAIDGHSEAEWAVMRARHAHGDAQIRALWRIAAAMADSYDDMAFTPPQLGRIAVPTLIVHGDRDPLYPVELGVELCRTLPRAELRVVPGGGHVPIFGDEAPRFVETALAFFARTAA